MDPLMKNNAVMHENVYTQKLIKQVTNRKITITQNTNILTWFIQIGLPQDVVLLFHYRSFELYDKEIKTILFKILEWNK